MCQNDFWTSVNTFQRPTCFSVCRPVLLQQVTEQTFLWRIQTSGRNGPRRLSWTWMPSMDGYYTQAHTHMVTHTHTDEQLNIYWSAATLKPLTGAGKPWVLVLRYPSVTLTHTTHLNTAAGKCTPQKLLRNGSRSHSDWALEHPWRPHLTIYRTKHRTPPEVALPWLEGPELPLRHEGGVHNIRQPFFNFVADQCTYWKHEYLHCKSTQTKTQDVDVARTIPLCIQVLWCIQSHTHTWWCPHMERGLAVVISQCCHHKQGGRKWDRLRERQKVQEGKKERLILTVGNLRSSLITHVSLLSCVCLSERE